jgi:nucleotide-binding universal stress UspA family protein
VSRKSWVSSFPTKILLATDGSKDAELAATTAADLANSTNSELHVATVAGGRAYHTEVPEEAEDLTQRAQEVAEELGAGLIVMGSRGLGGIRRALMGSVSDTVVRHAHCPVMIVRH